MTRNYLNTSIATLFYAPDDAGGGTAVLAADSPTGATIETSSPREMPAPEIVQPESVKEKPIRQPGVKTSKVDVAKELGLKASPSDLVAAEAKRIRDASGKFTAKTEEKKEDPAAKLGEAAVKPAAKVEVKPTPELVVPKVEPVKIKIGDQEKTAEEWAAYHKELSDKAAATVVPTKVEEKAPAATPEEQQAADKKVRDDWFEKTSTRFAPDQKEFDEMIANGDANKFGQFIAKAVEDTRQWVAAMMKPHLEKLGGFDERLNPVLEREKLNDAYQAESNYLEANKDIKAHADGVKTLREVSIAMHDEYDDLQQLVAANPTSPRAAAHQNRIKELEENYEPLITAAVKAKLGLNATAAPVVEKPALVTAVVKVRPPAQGGQLSTSGAPKKASSDSAQIAELKASGRW